MPSCNTKRRVFSAVGMGSFLDVVCPNSSVRKCIKSVSYLISMLYLKDKIRKRLAQVGLVDIGHIYVIFQNFHGVWKQPPPSFWSASSHPTLTRNSYYWFKFDPAPGAPFPLSKLKKGGARDLDRI